jgi:hypothetical protein
VRKVDLAAVALITVGTVAAAVVLPALEDDKAHVLPAPSYEVVEIYPDRLDPAPSGLDRYPVTMDPDEPFTCMLDLDCLLHEVEVVAGVRPPAPPPVDLL